MYTDGSRWCADARARTAAACAPFPSAQYYFETIFPRIPKPVMDNIIEDLKRRGLPHKPKVRCGACRGLKGRGGSCLPHAARRTGQNTALNGRLLPPWCRGPAL